MAVGGCIYLDNAASSWPKAPGVGEAMASFFAQPTGNPGRGGHRAAVNAGRVVEESRVRLARLINAPDANRMILAHSATDALNTAVHGVVEAALASRSNGRKPHAVATVLEHNAVLRPLHALQHKGLIDLTLVNCDAEGFVSPDDLLAATTNHTVLVAVTHASNVIGTIQPVREMGHRLRAQRPEALFLVDSSQTVGHIRVDVAGDCIDLLAFPGHKALLGPGGTGALFVSERAYDAKASTPKMVAHNQGGTGGNSDDPLMPREMPHQFEAGTLNAVGFAGLMAGLTGREALDREGAHERERRAVESMLAALAETPGARVLGPRDSRRRVSVVSFTLNGHDAGDVAATLDASFGIATRAGLQCAPGAHQAMGTDMPAQGGECGAQGGGGAVRASPGPFTTDDEVLAFARAIHAIARG